MEAPKNIDEALLAFQADPPVLTKDKKAHQSKYADLVQATEVILPKLNALGVTWLTSTRFLDDGRFVLDYSLRHVASDTARVGVWPLKLSDNPQQMGSQTTYARRYALTVATGVAAEEEDDDGNAATGRQFAQRAAQQRRTQPADGDKPPAGRTAQRRSQAPRGAQPPLPGEERYVPDPDAARKASEFPGFVAADTLVAPAVTTAQHRHMHALWRELGAGGDEHRDFRLRKTAEWLGMESLETSASLTSAQADEVIARLKERKQKAAAEAGAE